MSYYAKSHSRRQVKHPHIRHAISRAKSRYGISTPAVLRLEKMIQHQQGILRSQRQTSSRTLHEVKMEDNIYYAIYSRTTKHIVTLLSAAMGRRHFGDDEAGRCFCGGLLASVGGRKVCTIHPELAQ